VYETACRRRNTGRFIHVSLAVIIKKIRQMEYLKTIPITTLIIIYLFSCGLLYLIGFWTTFDIDIFNLISIYDIPKSFLLPFVLSNGLYVLGLTFNMIPSFTDNRKKINSFFVGKETWPNNANKIIIAITNIDFVLYMFILIWYAFTFNPLNNYLFWIISGYLIAFRITHRLVNSDLIIRKIPNIIFRSYIANLIVFIPISCFIIGKVSSLQIYRNSKIKTIEIVPISKNIQKSENSCSLKLLGFISDKIIISEIDNSKIYIYNMDSLSEIVINNNR
jgi:hypothetical protein